jgi:hypothetical protein
LEELKHWLDENLSKGFIHTSSSPTAAAILFVKIGDGSLKLVIDYRGINEGTMKNRYPQQLSQDTLMNLSKAKWFSTLDIHRAYNLICIAEGEEWKTAFHTHYRLFESLVMPFGRTNAPATFQNYINDVLAPYLDRFCTAYLDDTLIYWHNFEEQQQHVRLVLDAFAKVGLHLKPKKCEFHQQDMKYLGLIIRMEGIKMDPEKIRTLQDWEPPSNLKDIRAVLGFAISNAISSIIILVLFNHSPSSPVKEFRSAGQWSNKWCSTHYRQPSHQPPCWPVSTQIGTSLLKWMLLIISPPVYYLNTMMIMSFTPWPIFQKNIPLWNVITKFIIKN